MARKQKATAAEVRAFHGMDATQRGRISKEKVEAFEKATGKVYTPGHVVEKTVALKVRKVGKGGKVRTRTVQKTLAEVRALAGDAAGKRGLLSESALEAAGAALSDPEPVASESE